MYPYIPNNKYDEEKMLQDIGLQTIDDLFEEIPKSLRLNRNLELEHSKSELEIRKELSTLASKNKSISDRVCFLGAGAYDHYIPSVVNHLSSRSEYYTSYTPYQAEIAQATLRVIFEYQSYISDLTGLSVSNASHYDGATAFAEAALMGIASVRNSDVVLVSSMTNPQYIEVLNTYCRNRKIQVVEIATKNGKVDIEDLKSKIEQYDKKLGSVLVQSPNYYGIIEDVEEIAELAHTTKSKVVLAVDPISLAILKKPSELGVDIAVGEAQALGLSLSLGGPYLGFMACADDLARKMPGRIVGESVDSRGNRAFVLTLQAREQHIRRYKATSNICSNQGLMVLRACIYMSTMGKNGIVEVAQQCVAKAHYLADKLLKTGKCELVYDEEFFKEFAIKFNKPVSEVLTKLDEAEIDGGYAIEENVLLIAVTEKRSKQELDKYVEIVEGL